MKYSLILLPFLASLASAQDEVWKTLSKGDRVQITFRSGNSILGNLDSKPIDPRIQTGPVDYSTATEVTLDVSLEYPGLNGTMTIPKKEIKEIRRLQNLDPATMKRIHEELKKIQSQVKLDEDQRKASEGDRDKAGKAAREASEKLEGKAKDGKAKGEALIKEFEELQKGRELLARFPPEKYGPQTFKEMADMALRKQPIPLDMRDFTDLETQRLWNKALQFQKETQESEKKEKEKATPEKATPEKT